MMLGLKNCYLSGNLRSLKKISSTSHNFHKKYPEFFSLFNKKIIRTRYSVKAKKLHSHSFFPQNNKNFTCLLFFMPFVTRLMTAPIMKMKEDCKFIVAAVLFCVQRSHNLFVILRCAGLKVLVFGR